MIAMKHYKPFNARNAISILTEIEIVVWLLGSAFYLLLFPTVGINW